jgi:hypothetical protein
METTADPSKRSAKSAVSTSTVTPSKVTTSKVTASKVKAAKVTAPKVTATKATATKTTASKVPAAPRPRKPTRTSARGLVASGDASLASAAAEQRHQRIAVTAYYLAEARHFAPGHDHEDWFAAERLIDAGAGD